MIIRENITPRGDGNKINKNILSANSLFIRENITPRGDGNKNRHLLNVYSFIYKREYNSERRRKFLEIFCLLFTIIASIRENITPRGDGN